MFEENVWNYLGGSSRRAENAAWCGGLSFVILPQTEEDWLCWNVAHR